MIDIEELKRLYHAVIPRELWRGDGSLQSLYYGGESILQMQPPDDLYIKTHPAIVATVNFALPGHKELAAAIVALHNSAPALLAELEAARKVCELAAQLDQEAQAGAIAYQTAVDLQAALAAWQKASGEWR